MGRRAAKRRYLEPLLLALLLSVAPPLRADDVPEPQAGSSWRWRDEGGQVHFTDNPESIPRRFRGAATAIAPLSPERAGERESGDQGHAQPPTPGSLSPAARALERSAHFPFATVAVVAGEAVLVRVAARLTGLAIDLPGVAVACAAAAFVRWLDVPVLSSLGSFAIFFLVLWRLGRADSTETVALFLVVAAFLHVVALFALVRLPAG